MREGSMDANGGGDCVAAWDTDAVHRWLVANGMTSYAHLFCQVHKIDGKCLLMLNESDLRQPPLQLQVLGDIKRLSLCLARLRAKHGRSSTSYVDVKIASLASSDGQQVDLEVDEETSASNTASADSSSSLELSTSAINMRRLSRRGIGTQLRPECFKALLSMLYLLLVTWITSIVMVIVHDRVPDMNKYPPLPDIFLDNIPHIPWAFQMCELCGSVLVTIWIVVLLLHKHRFILIRRFNSLCGTVYLLRCVTMLITSLSVPGTHLDCAPREYGTLYAKIQQAFAIWHNGGLSIQGVRTCGDYMFSGHTVALTMLNFFITEYTSRRLYLLHIFSWLLNAFGVFFILSAHEHYSIDVFVAFYITSRLFMYYHTLSNNCVAQRRSGKRRTRIWFPMFSYFEQSVDGRVPNIFEWPVSLACVRRMCAIVTARLRQWGADKYRTHSPDAAKFSPDPSKNSPERRRPSSSLPLDADGKTDVLRRRISNLDCA